MSCAKPTLKSAAPVSLDSNRVKMKQIARFMLHGLLITVIVFSGCNRNAKNSSHKDDVERDATDGSYKETKHIIPARKKMDKSSDSALEEHIGQHRLSLYTFVLPGLKQTSAHLLPKPRFRNFEKLAGCTYFRSYYPGGPELFYSFDPIRGVELIPESKIRSQCRIPLELEFSPSSFSRIIFGDAAEGKWMVRYKIYGKMQKLLFPNRDATPSGRYFFNNGRSIMLADRNGRIYVIRDIHRPRMEHLREIEGRAESEYTPEMFGDPESTSVFVTTRDKKNSGMEYRLMKIDPITGKSNYNFARNIGAGRPVFSKEFGMLITGEENDHLLRIIDPESGNVRARVTLPRNVSFYDFMSLIGRPPHLKALINNRLVDLNNGKIIANIPGIDSEVKLGLWTLSPSGRVLCWRMQDPDRNNLIGHLQFLHIQCYDLEQKRSYGPVGINEIELDPNASFPIPHKIGNFIWIDDKTLLAVVFL